MIIAPNRVSVSRAHPRLEKYCPPPLKARPGGGGGSRDVEMEWGGARGGFIKKEEARSGGCVFPVR